MRLWQWRTTLRCLRIICWGERITHVWLNLYRLTEKFENSSFWRNHRINLCDNGSVGAYAPALPFASSISSSTQALAGVHTPHERVSPHIRAGGSRPPCGNIALYGHYTMRSKGHGADCGKTLYRRLTVPNYAPEKGKGHPPVMEAEAAAAMTCPGAIPLKTAMCACIRVCQYGVTI